MSKIVNKEEWIIGKIVKKVTPVKKEGKKAIAKVSDKKTLVEIIDRVEKWNNPFKEKLIALLNEVAEKI